MNRLVPVPVAAPLPCAGQLLEVPEGRYDWLRIEVGAPDRAETVGTAWLHYAHGVDPEHFVVPDGGAGPVWLPVPRRDALRAVRLPAAPELTVRSMTAVVSQHSTEERRAGA
ncbi:hypothetical protein SUDANB15_05986 [Streptomyces sp. enrichment culture]|uniref:hypothetical protein n=1 Tax=Streptomyces sp. enrichment culture TaxID=1795815 RepID=UPI003F573275